MKSNKIYASLLIIVAIMATQLFAVAFASSGNAEARDLSASNVSTGIRLTWTEYGNFSNVKGYYVFRRTASQYEKYPITDFTVTSGFIDSNVQSSIRYYYVVKPIYSDGTYGYQSNEISIVSTQTTNAQYNSSATGKIELRIGDSFMYVDGVSKEIDQGRGTAPIIVSSRVMIPIRSLIEEIGGTADWYDNEKKAVIKLNDMEVNLWLNEKRVRVLNNGTWEEEEIDVAPMISNARLFLPLRFVIENLGLRCEWDNTKTVYIYFTRDFAQTSNTVPEDSNYYGSSISSSSTGSDSYDSTSVMGNNSSPKLDLISDKYVIAGETLEFYISASDVDKDRLQYSLNQNLSNASIDTDTGRFVYNTESNQTGVVEVTFAVSDGQKSDTQNVNVYVMRASATSDNKAPQIAIISNRIVKNGQTVEFAVNARDEDGDKLSYSIDNKPSGATFNQTTGKFSWTPNVQAGLYYFNITATDGRLTDTEEVLISVGGTNNPPVLSSIGNKTVIEGETLSFNISASEPDGNSISYSASSVPNGAHFSSSNKNFKWTPSLAQAGVYKVKFLASDNYANDTEEITIQVLNRNRAPIMDSIGDKSVKAGEKLEFYVTAKDPDGDSLAYNIEGGVNVYLATGMQSEVSFNPQSRKFTWMPSSSQAGTYKCTFVVSDGYLSDNEEITIYVTEGNHIPVMDTIPNKNIYYGKKLVFKVSATDDDGDLLTYWAENLPSGASFTGRTREFSWTPTSRQVNTYNIKFKVSDGKAYDEKIASIIVNKDNSKPMLEQITSKTVKVGSKLVFKVKATDADGDLLTYSAENLPSGASFTAKTREFSWTPTSSQVNTYNVKFKVSDGRANDEETVRITSTKDNCPPELEQVAVQTVKAGNILVFNVKATDHDNDVLKYLAEDLPAGSTFSNSNKRFSWNTSRGSVGTYYVRFKVTDGKANDDIVVKIVVLGRS